MHVEGQVDYHRALCHQEGDSSSGSLPSVCGCQVCLLITLPGVTVSPARGDTPGRAMAGTGQCLLSTPGHRPQTPSVLSEQCQQNGDNIRAVRELVATVPGIIKDGR